MDEKITCQTLKGQLTHLKEIREFAHTLDETQISDLIKSDVSMKQFPTNFYDTALINAIAKDLKKFQEDPGFLTLIGFLNVTFKNNEEKKEFVALVKDIIKIYTFFQAFQMNDETPDEIRKIAFFRNYSSEDITRILRELNSARHMVELELKLELELAEINTNDAKMFSMIQKLENETGVKFIDAQRSQVQNTSAETNTHQNQSTAEQKPETKSSTTEEAKTKQSTPLTSVATPAQAQQSGATGTEAQLTKPLPKWLRFLILGVVCVGTLGIYPLVKYLQTQKDREAVKNINEMAEGPEKAAAKNKIPDDYFERAKFSTGTNFLIKAQVGLKMPCDSTRKLIGQTSDGKIATETLRSAPRSRK